MAPAAPEDLIPVYAALGYYCPIRVFPDSTAAVYRDRFIDYYNQNREKLRSLPPKKHFAILSETHVSEKWVHDIVSDPMLTDVVAEILGPDLLVWGTRWFSKMPGDPSIVSWHQDGTYWGLRPPNVTTAWVALSDSTRENGCMRVVPGSHKQPILPHRETHAPDNVLSRGQEVAVEVDEAEAVDLVLTPGEMSLHQIGIVHGSERNRSDKARIGIAIRYVTPNVVQDGTDTPFAMLVRGHDHYGNFELLPSPSEGDGDAARREVVNRMMQSILK